MSKPINSLEFIKSNVSKYRKYKQDLNTPDVQTLMIKFAQLKVNECIKRISKKAKVKEIKVPYEDVRSGGFYIEKIIDEDSILNAYDINEIK